MLSSFLGASLTDLSVKLSGFTEEFQDFKREAKRKLIEFEEWASTEMDRLNKQKKEEEEEEKRREAKVKAESLENSNTIGLESPEDLLFDTDMEIFTPYIKIHGVNKDREFYQEIKDRRWQGATLHFWKRVISPYHYTEESKRVCALPGVSQGVGFRNELIWTGEELTKLLCSWTHLWDVNKVHEIYKIVTRNGELLKSKYKVGRGFKFTSTMDLCKNEKLLRGMLEELWPLRYELLKDDQFTETYSEDDTNFTVARAAHRDKIDSAYLKALEKFYPKGEENSSLSNSEGNKAPQLSEKEIKEAMERAATIMLLGGETLEECAKTRQLAKENTSRERFSPEELAHRKAICDRIKLKFNIPDFVDPELEEMNQA